MINACLPKSIEKQVSSYRNLSLYTYTIGFPHEGEMLLTILMDGKEIVFSMITDCYLKNNHIAEKFASICRKKGIEEINAFVWTHPDEDHSLGIKDLLLLLDSQHKARIFVSSQIAKAEKLGDAASNVMTFLKSKYSQNYPTSFYPMEVSGDSAYLMFSLGLKAPLKDAITLKLMMLAPYSNVLFCKDMTKTGSSHNDLSIMYALEFNGMRYLFCGDLTKANIPYLDEDYLHAVKYVKVPHHGSNEPISLVQKLLENGNEDIKMSSTIFTKPHYMQEDKAMKEYVKLGDVWCTGPKKDEEPKHEYGCIQMSFNCNGKLLDANPVLKGNSYKWI